MFWTDSVCFELIRTSEFSDNEIIPGQSNQGRVWESLENRASYFRALVDGPWNKGLLKKPLTIRGDISSLPERFGRLGQTL